MPDEVISAENTAQEGVVAESQPAGEEIDGQEGLDLENTAGDGAKAADKDNLTKKMSERINQVRAKEVEPLKARLSDYEKREAEWREKEMELQALKEGKTVDEIKAEQAEYERSRQELLKNDPEVQALRTTVIEHQKAQLLDALKAEFPDDNITGVDDLGDDYKRMLMAGVHPFNAYRAIRDGKVKEQPQKKELPGSVRSDGAVIEKDFYTEDEIDRFTKNDYLRNPGLMERVRKSMARIRK